jgi:transposase-like protein
MPRRNFTREFKEAAVRNLRLGIPAGEVAVTCRVDPAVLRRWQKESDEFGEFAFAGYGKIRRARAEPRSKAIIVRLSDDELDSVRRASSAAGCRSLTEFARSRMLHAAGDPPPRQVEELLGELAAVMGKLTQTLPKD